MSLTQQLKEHIERLNADQQRAVLEFIREIERPRGEPGSRLLEQTQAVHIDAEELERMAVAIEQDCERIDPDEWEVSAGH